MMEKLLIAILAILGIAGLVTALAMTACIWAVKKMNEEEQAQIREHQLWDGWYDDHDVSGLLEED